MEIARPEGGREVTQEVEFYNPDAIIAVGCRVNCYQANLLVIPAKAGIH